LSGPHGLDETRTANVRGPSPTPATGAAFKPGDSLEGGRFVIVRQIGRGGMGTVYLAQDTVLGTLVALKIVPPDDRLIQEAQRAAACSGHEHVATVHNVLQSEHAGKRIGVLVLEYVAGRPANRILDDGPVDIDRAIKWVRQAALAVAHAHDSQVLHCDLKPGNMIVTPDDRVKVLDFGIARRSFDPTPAEPTYGTLPYMAPEQLLAGECSRATDVYSLGVTLFQLVTGRLPFTGDDRMIRMQILAAPPPSVSGIVRNAPNGMDAVFERALAKDPVRAIPVGPGVRASARGSDSHTPAALPASTQPSTISTWLWSSIAALAALLALTLTFGMVACRSFEVLLHIDSEFSASFEDYSQGWTRSAHTVRSVVVGDGRGHGRLWRSRAARALARGQRLAPVERLVEPSRSAGARTYRTTRRRRGVGRPALGQPRCVGRTGQPASTPGVGADCRHQLRGSSEARGVLDRLRAPKLLPGTTRRGVVSIIAAAIQRSRRHSETEMGNCCCSPSW
jgi:serine/threonine protein kinase